MLAPPTLLLSLALAACASEEPVLQGVPVEPLLTTRPSAEERAEAIADPTPQDVYAKAEGVLVDVRYLGGRSFRLNRDLLVDQLGGLQDAVELPRGDGTEYRFEGGTVRVLDDDIYLLRVPLPEPMRRTDALMLLGFPPQVDRYLILHREYRLNNTFEFRRIRLKRLDRDSELVTEVEAWQRVPGEPITVR